MISGTSKIWSKIGPVDLIDITELLKKLQENMGTSSTHIIFISENLEIRKLSIVLKGIYTICFVCFLFFHFVA